MLESPPPVPSISNKYVRGSDVDAEAAKRTYCQAVEDFLGWQEHTIVQLNQLATQIQEK